MLEVLDKTQDTAHAEQASQGQDELVQDADDLRDHGHHMLLLC